MKAIDRYLEGKTHLIWDWNGTLLDDVDLHVRITSEMLVRERLPALTREKYRQIFKMPVREYFEKLGFDPKAVTFERMSEDFVRQYKTEVLACQLYEGTVELLERLRVEGKRLAVLSAAEENALKKLTQYFGIAHHFDRIYGISDHHAESKLQRGRELLASWDAAPETMLLIGDMDHDWEVARELGIDVLLLGDGHQSFERLRALHPHTLRSRYHYHSTDS